jgi:hypothetical protein
MISVIARMMRRMSCGAVMPLLAMQPARASAAPVSRDSVAAATTLRWNETARRLVASHNTSGPMASRVYALVSMAQLAAVASVDPDGSSHDGSSHAASARLQSERAAIARASADVLRRLYPDSASARVVATELSQENVPTVWTGTSAAAAGDDSIGIVAAQRVLTYAANDGASSADCPASAPMPANRFWHDDAVPAKPQAQLPCFGKVRAWLYTDMTRFRADAAPAFDSPAFRDALAEVRHISDTRTDEQLATIDRWLDGNNTFTPPGHWNLIASDLIVRHQLDEAQAALVLAVLNIAMMDTHIACWDRKFASWEVRPWMVDSAITTPRGRPHHPADPSGHACAGGAGSGVLADLFPAERDSLLALGDEEGFTTVLSGVHYRFDVERGLQIGRTIAAKALDLRDLAALLSLIEAQ